ncbi:hypothetical protein BJ980_003625 [Nocardioides daedukensis]|uniref:DUF3558 domain-containing protein n=1 Tax=Nocardioides daedukensis TaxID=634462 RepID=A0A7Y9URS1_9ACTN|nr:hypothetical protein [Nocardioides daedukensis]NYG60702.1 hypothetical protein [Nocardioides daedukensis]
MKRILASLAAATTLVLVAGCGNDSGGEPAPKSSESSPMAEEPQGPLSLCEEIDGQAVAELFGRGGAFGVTTGTYSMGLPSFDSCTFMVGESKGAGIGMTYSWSIETVDEARWAAIRKHQQETNGRYTKIEDLAVGEDGFTYLNTAVAKVGDRAIMVNFPSHGADPAALAKALELAAPVVPKLVPPAPERTLDACSAADAEADAVLGGEATIRRGREGDYGLSCGWATPDVAVSVSATGIKDAEQTMRDDMEMFGGEEVPDLGTFAYYTGGVDGLSLSFLAAPDLKVAVSVPAGMKAGKADLIALATKLAPNYT